MMTIKNPCPNGGEMVKGTSGGVVRCPYCFNDVAAEPWKFPPFIGWQRLAEHTQNSPPPDPGYLWRRWTGG